MVFLLLLAAFGSRPLLSLLPWLEIMAGSVYPAFRFTEGEQEPHFPHLFPPSKPSSKLQHKDVLLRLWTPLRSFGSILFFLLTLGVRCSLSPSPPSSRDPELRARELDIHETPVMVSTAGLRRREQTAGGGRPEKGPLFRGHGGRSHRSTFPGSG